MGFSDEAWIAFRLVVGYLGTAPGRPKPHVAGVSERSEKAEPTRSGRLWAPTEG